MFLSKLMRDQPQWLLIVYYLFLASNFLFLIPHGKLIWILYAALVVPFSLPLLPQLWQAVKTSRLFWLLLVYMAYLLLSALWSPQFDLKHFLARFAGAATISHFLLLTAALRLKMPVEFDRYLKYLGFWVGCAALMVIMIWYSTHPPDSRMEGLGYLSHPIRSTAAFGVFALVAWHHLLQPNLHDSRRLGYGLVFAIVLIYIGLSWSRTVLLALVTALVLPLLIRPERRILTILAIIATTLLATLWLLPGLTDHLLRAMPYRPYIWLDALKHALHHPWFGHGYLASTSGIAILADGSLFPYGDSHSFFIANLRSGGILALGLALATIGYALCITFRHAHSYRSFFHFSLLIYGILCITPNEWELLTGKRESWIFLWLPFGLAISHELRQPHSLFHNSISRWMRSTTTATSSSIGTDDMENTSP